MRTNEDIIDRQEKTIRIMMNAALEASATIAKLEGIIAKQKVKLTNRKAEVKALTNSCKQWKEKYLWAYTSLAAERKYVATLKEAHAKTKEDYQALLTKQKVLFKANIGLNRSIALIECYEKVYSDKENSCGI